MLSRCNRLTSREARNEEEARWPTPPPPPQKPAPAPAAEEAPAAAEDAPAVAAAWHRGGRPRRRRRRRRRKRRAGGRSRSPRRHRWKLCLSATACADRRVAVGGGDGGGAVGGAGGGCEHSALVLPGHDPATDALNGRMGVEPGGGDTAGDVRRANSARFPPAARSPATPLTLPKGAAVQPSGLRRLTALACTRALTDASPLAGTREGSARWTERESPGWRCVVRRSYNRAVPRLFKFILAGRSAGTPRGTAGTRTRTPGSSPASAG